MKWIKKNWLLLILALYVAGDLLSFFIQGKSFTFFVGRLLQIPVDFTVPWSLIILPSLGFAVFFVLWLIAFLSCRKARKLVYEATLNDFYGAKARVKLYAQGMELISWEVQFYCRQCGTELTKIVQDTDGDYYECPRRECEEIGNISTENEFQLKNEARAIVEQDFVNKTKGKYHKS